ncbi:MAG: hypothetical protein ABF296_00385 [Oceanococcaceae bacterium]
MRIAPLMRRAVIAAVLSAMLTPLATAQGPQAEVRYWYADPSGTVREQGLTFDIDDDLEMSAESTLGVVLRWKGLFASVQNLEFHGRGAVTVQTGLPLPLPIIGDLLSGEEEVPFTSRVDLDDYTLGWTPVQVWGFRLGAAAKHLAGSLDAEEQDNVESIDVDATFPMLALSYQREVGALGLAVGVDGLWIEYDGDTVYEWQLAVSRVLPGLQLSAGFRQQRYDIIDGDDAIDATIDGLFATAGWRF